MEKGKAKVKVVSKYINNNDEATMTIRVCIADKDDKAQYKQLGDSGKSRIIEDIENDITDILGINDEWYRLNDVYIDYGSWYVTCSFATKELLPKEHDYIHDICIDIVDVMRGKKASLI